MSILIRGELEDSNWTPATSGEVASIKAIWEEKEAAHKSEPISSLPKAFWGFLDPNKGLGGIPDPKYAAVLEEQSPEHGDSAGLSPC